ncbi:MAG: aromatic ring-hydroxylating dioxygenase subunit alpha [Gammaproteobacteria bacterium]|nr:aromatic ring-hydroxylating dioxygenase subunit alpha [Gammaproteobacteria bacterium]
MNKPSENYAGRLSAAYPELGFDPVNIEKVFSPEYFELEREKIFKKVWLRVGRNEDIPNHGDFMVKEFEFANTSVVITRDQNGEVNAFHNVCTHRANRVAYTETGNAPRGFTCRFHGWNFGLDGKLNFVPEAGLFPTLDTRCAGLPPVSVDTWEGWIFVNLDPSPKETLREYLGELADGYPGFFDDKTKVATLTIDAKANWKIFLDAFVETYHFAFVHQLSAAAVITSPDNPYGYMDAARMYDRHRVISARSNPNHTPSPAEAVVGKLGGHQTLAPDLAAAATRQLPPGLNPQGLDDWATDIIVIFPMTNIQPLDGWYVTQNYWPISHNETRWEMTIYMQPAQTASHWMAQEYNTAYIRDVVREDLNNLEMIQQNLEAGILKEMHFGDQEIMIRHSYKVVDDYVKG